MASTDTHSLVPEKRAPRPLTMTLGRRRAPPPAPAPAPAPAQPGPYESNNEEKRYRRFVQSVFSVDDKDIHDTLHAATARLYKQSLMNIDLNPEDLDIIKGHWRPFRFALDVNNDLLIAELMPYIDTKKLYKLIGEGLGRVNTIVVEFLKNNIRVQWANRWAQRAKVMAPREEERAERITQQDQHAEKKKEQLQASESEEERRQEEKAKKFKLDAIHIVQSQFNSKLPKIQEKAHASKKRR